MNNNKSQIFNAENVIEKKELKKHPERDRVKTVNAMAEAMIMILKAEFWH